MQTHIYLCFVLHIILCCEFRGYVLQLYKEVMRMIIYKDIFGKLKQAGYNTSRIRREKLIPEGTLQNIRDGKLVNLKTIDTICKMTGCKIEELLEYKEEK